VLADVSEDDALRRARRAQLREHDGGDALCDRLHEVVGGAHESMPRRIRCATTRGRSASRSTSGRITSGPSRNARRQVRGSDAVCSAISRDAFRSSRDKADIGITDLSRVKRRDRLRVYCYCLHETMFVTCRYVQDDRSFETVQTSTFDAMSLDA
jgi:hypothetical protein